jgi:uncharacterized protein (TIGR00297 family)
MLNLLLAHGWANTPGKIAVAAAVTVGFAVLARALRGVSGSGALVGGMACFVLYACAGPAAFAALGTLFLLTWAATRLGFRHKQELGVAERRDGRNGWQVLANLGAATVCSMLFGVTGNRAWIVATVAALAEAATDTVASEIGQTRGRTALLITTWQPVPSGTDGGVTFPGTSTGALAGFAIAGVSALTGLLTRPQLWIAGAAGITGMLVDSLLGATCQRRGWMNNDAVNFLGTLMAAATGYVIASLTGG